MAVRHSKQRSSLAVRLFGDPAEVTLEDRTLNSITALTFAASMAMLAMNLVLGNPLRDVLISVGAAASAGAIYAAARVFRRAAAVRVPFYLTFLAICTFVWLTNAGSQGTGPFCFFVLIVGGVVILPRGRRVYYLGATLSLIPLLLLVERVRPEWIIQYSSSAQRLSDVATVLMICLVITAALMHQLHLAYRAERQVSEEAYERIRIERAELRKALEEIRVLEGLLPICASCKSIRDEEGTWLNLESYLTANSDLQLSHGICPTCNATLYGELEERGKSASTPGDAPQRG